MEPLIDNISIMFCILAIARLPHHGESVKCRHQGKA